MGIYKNMSEILKDGRVGNFELSHFEITENDFRARFRQGIPCGEYVRLTNGWDCVMSNTPMEKRTNIDFVHNAHGKVLIGGLGIGLILLAIQDKEDVSHITVIEKNIEVIELIKDQLPLNNKVEIVHADVFDYKPLFKYNTIYMDIWNNVNSTIYEEEMKPLIKRYRRYLVSKQHDEKRYIECWAKYQAKHNKALI